MPNTVDLNKFKNKSKKHILKTFYDSLEKRCIHKEQVQTIKTQFFHQSRGRFINILRLAHGKSLNDLKLRIPLSKKCLLSIENGEKEISDKDFFRVCGILNENNEASIFLEKLEEAFKPNVKKGRYDLADAVRLQFGIVFADPSKYETPKKGALIRFDFSGRKRI